MWTERLKLKLIFQQQQHEHLTSSELLSHHRLAWQDSVYHGVCVCVCVRVCVSMCKVRCLISDGSQISDMYFLSAHKPSSS